MHGIKNILTNAMQCVVNDSVISQHCAESPVISLHILCRSRLATWLCFVPFLAREKALIQGQRRSKQRTSCSRTVKERDGIANERPGDSECVNIVEAPQSTCAWMCKVACIGRSLCLRFSFRLR